MLRINHAGLPAITGISHAEKALLAYLTLHRRRIHSREVLASLFWGDSSDNRARSCLSTALWRLRKVLESKDIPKGTYLATLTTGEVGFNRESNHWIDVGIFENRTKHALAKPFAVLEPEDVRNIEKVLELHTGELLEGFYDD